jgi:hypothetical protein
MQLADLFASLPIWVVLLGTLLLAVASVEAGHRWGRHKHEQASAGGGRENEAPAGAMVGAMLGLLAFLLAFTFGMAADGFHERKVVLLHEANAIRATHLRAALIVEPERSEVRRILRDYVNVRLQWVGGHVEQTKPTAQDLLNQLWVQVAAAGIKAPSDTVSLFVDAANDVIKLNAERTMVRERSRIPGEFWLMLYLVAMLSLAAMGYHGGVAGSTRSPVMVAVTIAFSVVILLIVDLDRPGEGWVNVSQDAMLELRDALRTPL